MNMRIGGNTSEKGARYIDKMLSYSTTIKQFTVTTIIELFAKSRDPFYNEQLHELLLKP